MTLINRATVAVNSNIGRTAVTALFVLLFVSLWFKHISGATIQFDAAENLRLAINLQHHHIYSIDSHAPYHASNTREPVPVFTMALAVGVVDLFMGPAEDSAYFEGPRARYIKLQNIVWMAVLTLTVFLATWHLTGSYYGSLLSVVLINRIPHIMNGIVYPSLIIDTLYTEIPAAALLLIGSALFVVGLGRKNLMIVALAGVAFGATALTKGAFLYVFVGFAILCGLASVFCRNFIAPLLRPTQVIALTAGFILVVAPWLIRNHSEVGTYQITGRGGLALHQRAVNNEMTNEELFATLYWWAPDPVSSWVFGHALNLSPNDFIRRDSRYRRLSRNEGSEFYDDDYAAFRAGRPDDAISIYFKGSAEERQYKLRLEAAGIPNADRLADEAFQKKGIELMRAHPWRQLIETPLFMYRAAAYIFITLLLVFIYAWRKRRGELALFVGPSLLLLCFYALLTDYIDRYAVLIVPLAIVAAVAVLHDRFFGHE